MVLQYRNVLLNVLDKFDSNNNNNHINNNNIESESAFNYEEYLKTFSNFSNTRETIEELLEKMEVVLYDCDQLLKSDLIINNNEDNKHNNIWDAIKLIGCLRERHKKIIFTTNRSDKTRQQMLIHLNSLGIEASINEMFPNSYATAVYLKAIGFEREVLVFGSDAIEKELDNMGIQSTGVCCHSSPKDMNPGFTIFNMNPRIGAVIVSFDCQIPLPHLMKACSYATKPDCFFIIANYEDSYVNPERTAQKAAIQVRGDKGFISLDKSNTLYYHCIGQIHPYLHPNKAVIITNSLSSDLAFGKNNGIKTVLIDSDFHNKIKTISKRNLLRSYKPDHLTDSLSSLAQLLSE